MAERVQPYIVRPNRKMENEQWLSLPPVMGNTRYINLAYEYMYGPYYLCTICSHAGVTQELMEAVLFRGEQLTDIEIYRISRLMECSPNYLKAGRVQWVKGKKAKKKLALLADRIMNLQSIIDTGQCAASELTKLFLRSADDFYAAVCDPEEFCVARYRNALHDVDMARLNYSSTVSKQNARGLEKKEVNRGLC